LTLLAWAVNEIKDERIIASLKEENGIYNYKQLVMPILEAVARNSRRKDEEPAPPLTAQTVG
jgi:hypothetical protein